MSHVTGGGHWGGGRGWGLWLSWGGVRIGGDARPAGPAVNKIPGGGGTGGLCNRVTNTAATTKRKESEVIIVGGGWRARVPLKPNSHISWIKNPQACQCTHAFFVLLFVASHQSVDQINVTVSLSLRRFSFSLVYSHLYYRSLPHFRKIILRNIHPQRKQKPERCFNVLAFLFDIFSLL